MRSARLDEYQHAVLWYDNLFLFGGNGWTLSPDGCTAHVPDFPKVTAQAPTLDAALLKVKQQIQKALRQYKNPPIPTKQEQIVVPNNSVLVLVKAS